MKFILVLLGLKLITQSNANGPGTVFVQLISYYNPSGKTYKDESCDSWFSQFVHDTCDLVFSICLKDVNIKNPKFPCNIGSISTINYVFHDTLRVRFESNIGFIPNPFNFTLSSVPENLQILINVTDDDLSGQQLISKMHRVIQLPIIGPDEDSSNFNKIVLSTAQSILELKVYGSCKQFYYGSGCNQYCKPSFSLKTGFYACDRTTGQKHCLIGYFLVKQTFYLIGNTYCFEGWTGVDCRQRDWCILDNPCHGNSQCSMNESVVICVCPESLMGKYCQTPKRPCDSNPCQNGGLCVRDSANVQIETSESVCICPRNFTGKNCEKDVDECKWNPCKNDAECINLRGSYNCICINNHWGVDCEKPPVYSVKGIDSVYFLKTSTARFMQNTIIVLLVSVICLIFIIGILSLLYYRNRLKLPRSQSIGSVYSEIHNDDKFTNVTDAQVDPNDQYINYYELENEDSGSKENNLKGVLKYCEKESVI